MKKRDVIACNLVYLRIDCVVGVWVCRSFVLCSCAYSVASVELVKKACITKLTQRLEIYEIKTYAR